MFRPRGPGAPPSHISCALRPLSSRGAEAGEVPRESDESVFARMAEVSSSLTFFLTSGSGVIGMKFYLVGGSRKYPEYRRYLCLVATERRHKYSPFL